MPKRPFIIAEGSADNEFLKRLIVQRGLQEFHISDIQPVGGYQGFFQRLQALRTPKAREAYSAVILVADNDDDPAGRFEEIKQQIGLANNGAPAADLFGTPNAPRTPADGSTTLPSVSILMLPWDNEQGCLESLCLRAANPKYAKQLGCTTALCECVDITGWELSQVDKLRMQCFLAAVCQTSPTTPLRFAWSTDGGRPGDIFPLEHLYFNQIADFLASFP